MGQRKIASQCAHAATGMYAELMQSDRFLLKSWEQCGQPKIVCTCKNQQEMIKLKEAAENIGLPTFVVSDAGRTQVAAGSRTVLAVEPGPKSWWIQSQGSCVSSNIFGNTVILTPLCNSNFGAPLQKYSAAMAISRLRVVPRGSDSWIFLPIM